MTVNAPGTDGRPYVDDVALPPDLALLWDRPPPARRGPKPALSLDAVVATAVDLADADGLAQLSMARVAERLGYTTMSLYRYVRSKDDLITLMNDAAQGEPPAPVPGDWRAGLEAWARGVFGVYMRHRWMLYVPITGPPAGPAALRWMEAALQNFDGTDVPDPLRLAAVQTLNSYVVGEARLSAELAAAGAPALSYGQLLRRVTAPDTHPALTRLVASGIFDADDLSYDPDVELAFGLHRILDGIARLVGPADD
ncbi:TetR/AcrR family transcriptional regulator [Spirilliplanes yamanashiensis]|nr:TetR/AcrR family transcriptional regulator [Spirilliplanes yamanashiensis]MDP9816208.1 AcrR family transcriptional regulator [Spirilliplanes yamanashiensis]